MKYIHNSDEVDAFRYYMDPRPNWFCDKVSSNEIVTTETRCIIKSPSGKIKTGQVGDYIVRDACGEIYPHDPVDFNLHYHKIGGEPSVRGVILRCAWRREGAGLKFKTDCGRESSLLFDGDSPVSEGFEFCPFCGNAIAELALNPINNTGDRCASKN